MLGWAPPGDLNRKYQALLNEKLPESRHIQVAGATPPDWMIRPLPMYIWAWPALPAELLGSLPSNWMMMSPGREVGAADAHQVRVGVVVRRVGASPAEQWTGTSRFHRSDSS